MSVSSNYYVINLTNDGQGQTTVNLGSTVVTLVTRWNTVSKQWSLDILDQNGDLLLAGLALVPGVNILKPYTVVSAMIGSLVLAEMNSGDYMDPNLLGTGVVILWFPPGVEAMIPMPYNFIPTEVG